MCPVLVDQNNWPFFNKWNKTFEEIGYPYMWQGYSQKPKKEIKSVKGFLSWLTVAKIKNILKENNAYPKPVPKNRGACEQAMIDSVKFKQVKALAEKIYNEDLTYLRHLYCHFPIISMS